MKIAASARLYICKNILTTPYGTAGGDAVTMKSMNLGFLQRVVVAEQLNDFETFALVLFFSKENWLKTHRWIAFTDLDACLRGYFDSFNF